MREFLAEGAHHRRHQRGVDLVELEPLHQQAAGGEVPGDAAVEFARKEAGDAAHPRVGRLRDDDVVAAPARGEEGLGVVDEDGELIRYKVKPHFKGQDKDRRNGEIYGEFLSSRFSQALGFFADDEWVADVTCPDCEKSLTRGFQGASFSPFQPAAGVELPLARGIDVKCNNKDSGALAESLQTMLANGAPRAEIDAFKLWLAFIDHGDTKTDNHKFACLKSRKDGKTRICEPGQAVFYVGDMGSTFGHSRSSENKATLEVWRKKDPIEVSGGRCTTTAKSVGDTNISEAGRKLLADNLQRLLDAEKRNRTITRVFEASRNAERDRPASEWAAEFVRKAQIIINARCSN